MSKASTRPDPRRILAPYFLVLAAGVIIAIAACATPRPRANPATSPAAARLTTAACGHEMLHGLLWLQSAAESRAVAHQAYALASLRLDQALADPSRWDDAVPGASPSSGLVHPAGFAIVVDIDETVLDGTPYDARLALAGKHAGDPASLEAWVREAAADAVPGAVAFAQEAARRGLRVFYLTNRRHQLEEATRANLAARGFPLAVDEDVVLTRGESGWDSRDKEARRQAVAARYRVLMVVGDELNDFFNAHDLPLADRDAQAERYESRWGRQWIMIANPLYGSWERAITGSESRPGDDLLKRKLGALRTAPRHN